MWRSARSAAASRWVRRRATARIQLVRQIVRDPDDNRDWVLDAVVDCDASDEAGELVLATSALHRLDG
ncbi:MAG: DUF3516 domain-containing protein [Micropruina sp.]